MEITITLREAAHEETLCLDDGLLISSVLRRLAAEGVYTARAASCRYLRSALLAELLCTHQRFREAGIVSGDDLELV